MTMNNRQAGAYRELVRKEERAREKWTELHGHYLTQNLSPQANGHTTNGSAGASQQFQSQASTGQYNNFQETNGSFSPTSSFNGNGSTANGHNSLPLAPSSIYDQAIRISSPRLEDSDSVNIPSQVQRRVVRQVEVPFTRLVKVPVTTRKIVPVLVEKKVKVKKLIEVPSTKLVKEEYTEVVQQPAVRTKEIWVKKLVPERYSQPLTVKKTRQVAVPTTVLKEVDDYEIVKVTENKAVEVPGYRIDEVQDSKLVEVEELQNYQLQPQSTGQAQVLSARDIGPVNGMHHSRRIGTEIYHPQDSRHQNIEEDTLPFSGSLQRPAALSNTGSLTARNGSSTFRQTGQQTISGAFSSSRRSNANGSQTQRSSADAPLTQSQQAEIDQSIGFKVRDNAEVNGVIVYRVAPGQAAERAGVRVGDVIIYVNNRPSRNLSEFRSVVNHSSGPVFLQVRRRGVQKLMLTVHR